ncbi:L-lactate MFS transporter [Anaeromicropila herbilytica]|uniref:MFS transporter n=1 Tax=Anaeromicropila herbilytica TaxID=2785025 RepID=A0A7R7ICM1_9FIRM|nr:OFA family MFS transporter [Anaeromicropila herbilytica]BCN30079.1 MFS transporter [Anaeromicropila herbilytica]
MNYQRKRWLVLVASCLINLCIGSMYAWSVFAAPMAAHLKVDPGSLAIIFTITNAVGPITMITGGRINDKFGPRWVIFVGGIIYAAGFLISSVSNTMTMLGIGYGLGCGLGMGMIYGCTINNSIKFFPDKRGLIGGIATATYGLSSVLMPPIANSLITNYGILSTFRYIGIAFLIIICGSALFIEKCPEGYRPDNMKQVAVKGNALTNEKTWREMLKDPMFYLMFLMLVCSAFYGLMVTSQASPIAQNLIKVSPATAAICVSVLALFNVGGRICAGILSDLFGRINTLIVMLIISIAGLGLLITCGDGDLAKFMVGVSIIGVSFGAFMGVFPGFTADQFGTRNNSVNYGIMFIAFALAGVFGPMVLKNIYSTSGTYKNAFLIGIVFVIAGLVLGMIYRVLDKKKK